MVKQDVILHQTVEKVYFYKNRANSLTLSPNPFPSGERLCMLGWLCVLQSLVAYTPGIRAGAILLGLPPLVPVGGFAPATPFSENTKVYRQSEIRRYKTADFLCINLYYLFFKRSTQIT